MRSFPDGRRPLIRELAQKGFRGTTTELLAKLNSLVPESARRSIRWPKAPNALTNTVRRMAGNLRSVGIDLQFSRADRLGRRMVSVSSAKTPKRSSVTSASSDRETFRR